MALLGLNWAINRKAKTQLTKAGRKLGEDYMGRHRRESFAEAYYANVITGQTHTKLVCSTRRG